MRMDNIIVAKTAGFCFGVDRAVKIVYNELEKGKKVATLGPIIHNQNVVDDLASKGVVQIDKPSEANSGQTVIIRSHGVTKAVYDELVATGAEVIDATCTFVKRIHKIAMNAAEKNSILLVAGDKTHPEVEGIVGHYCGSPSVYVFADENELNEIIGRIDSDSDVTVVSQTTFNTHIWRKCQKILEEKLKNVTIYNTICDATSKRQNEAAQIAKNVDIMLIVGGRHSSNTHKLKTICDEFCNCFLIENASELSAINFCGAKSVGISAGASTPAYIIKEVNKIMSEKMEEFDFASELEKTLKKIHVGKKVDGTVVDITANDEVIVDIGTKHTGIVTLSELTDDTSKKASDIVSKGDVIPLIVLSTSDQEGIVKLSKKKVDARAGFEKLVKAKEENETIKGSVIEVVKNGAGLIAAANGVRVFIPASQSGVRRGGNLNDLLKTEVEFKLIEINEVKNKAVGSIRQVLSEKRSEIFDKIKVGDVIEGVVKSNSNYYGIFVDIGGVDGLVRRDDLSWKRFRLPSEIVNVGDKIEVTVKDIDKENGKIALTAKKAEDDPWENFKANYQKGQVVKAKIVSIAEFGAFAQIIDGVDGLIHISQIANQHVENVSDILKEGQEVEAAIISIDYDTRRIGLSMRALLEDEGETEE